MNALESVPIAWRKRARDLLVQALYQWQMSGTDAAKVEAEFRTDNGRKTDWDFFHSALSTIAGNTAEIDAVYLPHIDRKAERLDPVETGILRLGIYELSRHIETPYKVVINECVDLARKYGATDSHKYINSLLDKAARELRQIEIHAS